MDVVAGLDNRLNLLASLPHMDRAAMIFKDATC
jgi:hypothetical protein